MLGVTVEKTNETCHYSPADGGGLPVAVFFTLMPGVCNEAWATGTGYTEPVTSLDTEAYLRTDGEATAQIAVCAAAPFDVAVDALGEDTEVGVAAAETLARMVLEAE